MMMAQWAFQSRWAHRAHYGGSICLFITQSCKTYVKRRYWRELEINYQQPPLY